MKCSLFFIFVVVIVLIGSCAKTTSNPPTDSPIDSVFLVKTITEHRKNVFDNSTLYHNVYVFYYDSLNRISKTHSDNSDIDFEYSDRFIRKNVYSNTLAAKNYSYYYSTDSLLDSSVSVFDTLSIHKMYTYNLSNQVIQETETSVNNNGDTITIFLHTYEYDAKGNLTQTSTYFDSTQIYGDRFFYSDSANFSTSVDMDPDKIIHSLNLVNKSYHESSLLGLSSESHYSYEFDAYQRIKVVTEWIGYFSGQTETYTLTYEYY